MSKAVSVVVVLGIVFLALSLACAYALVVLPLDSWLMFLLGLLLLLSLIGVWLFINALCNGLCVSIDLREGLIPPALYAYKHCQMTYEDTFKEAERLEKVGTRLAQLRPALAKGESFVQAVLFDDPRGIQDSSQSRSCLGVAFQHRTNTDNGILDRLEEGPGLSSKAELSEMPGLLSEFPYRSPLAVMIARTKLLKALDVMIIKCPELSYLLDADGRLQVPIIERYVNNKLSYCIPLGDRRDSYIRLTQFRKPRYTSPSPAKAKTA